MTETNAEKWSLEKIKRYDDSWWLRYLEVYSVFDTEGIKAQKYWLIEQAERVQELEIDLNICKISKKTIGDINGFTDEVSNENKRLREAMEQSNETEIELRRHATSFENKYRRLKARMKKVEILVNSDRVGHAVKFDLQMIFREEPE